MFVETDLPFNRHLWTPLDWMKLDNILFTLYEDRNDLELKCRHLQTLPTFIHAQSVDALKKILL
jgi:hypothetical protein